MQIIAISITASLAGALAAIGAVDYYDENYSKSAATFAAASYLMIITSLLVGL